MQTTIVTLIKKIPTQNRRGSWKIQLVSGFHHELNEKFVGTIYLWANCIQSRKKKRLEKEQKVFKNQNFIFLVFSPQCNCSTKLISFLWDNIFIKSKSFIVNLQKLLCFHLAHCWLTTPQATLNHILFEYDKFQQERNISSFYLLEIVPSLKTWIIIFSQK